MLTSLLTDFLHLLNFVFLFPKNRDSYQAVVDIFYNTNICSLSYLLTFETLSAHQHGELKECVRRLTLSILTTLMCQIVEKAFSYYEEHEPAN